MELNKKNIKKILWIITFAIVLFSILQNMEKVSSVVRIAVGLLSPLLIGLCIAFVFNVPMRFIEAHLLRNRKKFRIPSKLKRPLSITLTLLFVTGVISIVVFLLLPELINTFGMLKNMLPIFIEDTQTWAMQFSDEFPEITTWIMNIELDWNKITSFIQNGATNVISSTFNAAASVVNGTINFFLGLIFAFYLLSQKEKLMVQAKRFLYAFFPEKKMDSILRVGSLANKTFSNFISGQCTEAVILGVLCFIGMSVFRFPYALMISVLVGFMSLIPIFGAFIGVAIGAFLILMVSPLKALWFVVFFIVLQQVEGNLIYPRVVGNSIGLPAIWVLVAVIVGGSAMGILGMILFIPLCSVLYALLREAVPKKLSEKGLERNETENTALE